MGTQSGPLKSGLVTFSRSMAMSSQDEMGEVFPPSVNKGLELVSGPLSQNELLSTPPKLLLQTFWGHRRFSGRPPSNRVVN